MDKTARDLIEIIHFTENVSAKIHGVLDKAEIYRTVKEEFAKSKRYTASILLLTDDGSKLRIAQTSVSPGELKAGEKAAGVRLKGYKIDLQKSRIYSQVVREGKTIQVNVSDIIGELFPRPLAYLISKIMGYEKSPSILTPLKRHGKIIGVLAMTSADLAEYFILSVRNLGQHIAIAFELADEQAERKRAEEELQRAHNDLERRVEERTTDLILANEQLEQEITERKRAGDALRESEEHYRTIFENTVMGMYRTSSDGGVIAANPALVRMLGYSSFEELAQRNLEEEGFEPEYPRSLFKQRVEKEGQVIGLEASWVKRDGTPLFVRESAKAIRDDAGNVLYYEGTVEDITERKRAIDALRESEEKYRTFVEQSLQGLIVVQDLRLVFANTAFAEISGYTVEELLSLSPEEVRAMVHPEDQALVWGRFRDRLQGKAVPPRYEYRGIRKDGTVRWLEMFASRTEYGGKPAIQGAIIDITDRKLAERALERRATQLATVGEIGRQITSILDPDELLRQIVNSLEEAFGYRYVYVLLLDENSNELVARAGAGPGRVLEGTRIPLEARSINAYVARTGEPLLVNDVPREPMYLLLAEVADTKSELAVPIKVKDQVIGTLDVQSTELYAFDESDLFTLQALASQAGIAIENARLYEETKRQAEEMTSVYNIGVATTSTLNVDEVLNLVCEQVSRLMEVSSCYIALYDAEKEELHFELALDEGVPLAKFARKLADGAGLSGWIVQSKQPLLIRDAEKDEFPAGAIVVGLPARSWLGVPLLHRDQVVGVMGVQSYQPNAFDEEDQQLLSTIAAQVAIAIENARLFTETNGRAKDLALLLGTSTAISSSLDLDQILKTVSRHIIASLVATFCRVTLLDETEENLVIRAVYPIREQEGENNFGRQCPLAVVPWHKRVIETGEPVVLRQDVPELTLSDEECEMVLTKGVQSAALIPLIVGGRMLGVISLGEERSWERSPFTPEKVQLCQSIAAQAAVAIENAHLYEELQQSFLQTISALAAAVDAKDLYTGGHSQRTTELAAAIAQGLALSDEEIELIRYAGLLHDVGKIGISERILLKPGPLDAEEWEVVRSHPTIGANIVERAASLYEMVPIILHHHERYDGQGYPAGLRGGDIPFKACILAVADAYEAMTSDRAYRPAMTVEQALATLRQGADEQWDGKVVEVLHKIIREQG